MAADDGDPPARVVSRANRVAAAEASSATKRAATSTTIETRTATQATAPPNTTAGATPIAPTPAATSGGDATQTLQDPGTQFLGGGGAGPLPMVMAGKGDALAAVGKLIKDAVKEGLKSKTIANPVQRLDGNHPSLLDRIPKIPVPREQTTMYREAQAAAAERQRRVDDRTRQIDEITRSGRRLTFMGSDGIPVYTIDGKTFVRGDSLIKLDRPRQFAESDQHYDRNTDIIIRNNLRLDPQDARGLWGRTQSESTLRQAVARVSQAQLNGISGYNPANNPLLGLRSFR
ncbi:hypothetical protein ACN27E_09070 [Mycobacterium sp. WMMD1722]|uniref:hypothetical protein n=1 Tax=Mycobacterium sp. WMMD1722 TaxID=3404117 RepID=UPI003BF4A527